MLLLLLLLRCSGQLSLAIPPESLPAAAADDDDDSWMRMAGAPHLAKASHTHGHS